MSLQGTDCKNELYKMQDCKKKAGISRKTINWKAAKGML